MKTTLTKTLTKGKKDDNENKKKGTEIYLIDFMMQFLKPLKNRFTMIIRKDDNDNS